MKKAKLKEDNKVKYGTISIPQPLIDRLKEKIKGTGMPSVSAYVVYILRQIISGEPESEVRNRLKSLGYI